jgi:hypothetical protein
VNDVNMRRRRTVAAQRWCMTALQMGSSQPMSSNPICLATITPIEVLLTECVPLCLACLLQGGAGQQPQELCEEGLRCISCDSCCNRCYDKLYVRPLPLPVVLLLYTFLGQPPHVILPLLAVLGDGPVLLICCTSVAACRPGCNYAGCC